MSVNWYKLSKNHLDFPFNLDSIWEKINALKINNNPPFPKSMGKINNIEIMLVDGDKIKKKNNIDYVEGGHDLIYDFIPEKQIWIDGNMSKKTIPHIVYHEFIERYLMENKEITYDEAHDVANEKEKEKIL